MKDWEQLQAAWIKWLGEFCASHFVTLCYNNVVRGTASWCYRVLPTGRTLRLPTDNVPVDSRHSRLGFTRSVRLEQLQSDIDYLHAKVDRQMCGSRYNRLPSDKRSSFVGFVERPHQNLHVHLAWNIPTAMHAAFADTLSECWQSQGAYRSSDVRPITSEAVVGYMCKAKEHFQRQAEPLDLVMSRNLTTHS